MQIAPKSSANLGVSLENAVFNTLSQKSDDVSYLKETHEIDFCTKEALYKVSYDIRDEKTQKRELNAIEHFKQQEKRRRLVTYDTNRRIGDVAVS